MRAGRSRALHRAVGMNCLHGSRDGMPARHLATGAPTPTDVTIDTISAVLGATTAF
jgi:hypothetical protein